MNYEIRKATMPYYKPFVVVDCATQEIAAHCDTKEDATRVCQDLVSGRMLPQVSVVQKIKTPQKAFDTRINNPYNVPSVPVKTSVVKPGQLPHRTIVI